MEPIVNSSVMDLARAFGDLKKKEAELEQQLKDIQAEQDMIEDKLRMQMEGEEMTKFSMEGYGTFYLSTKFYPKVVGDPEKVVKWLDENGASTIAPRKVNLPSLREFFEERMEKDLPLPPTSLIETSNVTSVVLRKTK